MSKGIGGAVRCLLLIASLGTNHTLAIEESDDQKIQIKVNELVQTVQLNDLAGDVSMIDKLQAVARKTDQATRAEAQLLMGKAYRDGLAGTEKNKQLAFTFLEQAAGRDGLNAEAQYELGRAYMKGEGTDRNLIAAYMWTELSLHGKHSMSVQAEAQRDKLASMLSKAQRDKAIELVSQLETLYLK